jgi:alkylation response protein AidB-like acyl-CoA dehydrogenase
MATYGLDDETRALRARVREFIDGEVIPAEPDLMAEGPAAVAAMARLKQAAKDAGLWALGHPKEIGGGGVPFMPFVYLNEIIGRSHWGQAAVGSLSMQDSIMLHLYGSAEQKRRWLEPLVAGEIYPSVGLTEPEVAGSDPTLMQSAARLDGDQWVVNAHKWFTSGANHAAFTTIFAITEPDAEAHAKFSSIIVPTSRTLGVRRVSPSSSQRI